MAKQISFTNDQDITFPQSYWRIIKVDLNVQNKTLKFVVAGYKNALARNSSKEPIKYISYFVTDDQYIDFLQRITNRMDNPVQLGYERMTQDDLFKNGLDV